MAQQPDSPFAPKTPHQSNSLNDLKQEKALEYFNDVFSDFNKDYEDRLKGWNKWNSMWRGVFSDGSPKNIDGVFHASKEEVVHKSRLFVNQTKQAVITAVSNVMGILFQEPIPFTVAGRASKVQDDISEMIKLCVWYFLQNSQYQIQARRHITTAAIYGTSYGKVFMDVIKDSRIHVDPQMNPIINTEVMSSKRIAVVNSIPTVKFAAVDIFDIWQDPEADWLNSKGRGAFHRVFRSAEYIKGMVEAKKFVLDNMGLLDTSSDPGGSSSRDQRRTIEGLMALKRTEIPLFDFWGDVPPEIAKQLKIEPLEGEYVVPVHAILMADRQHEIVAILKSERNPLPAGRIPIIKDIWEDLGNGSQGRGIPENTHGPQMALNVTVNTRLDNKASAIQQILGVNDDMIDDPDDLKFKQNWVIRCKGDPRTAIMPISVPDLTANASQEAEYFERLIEESSGMTKFVQGTDSFGSNRTASGINQVFQAASKLLRDITFQFEQNLVSETATLMYQHILMFMPDEFLVNLTQNPMVPEMRKVALKDIAADVQFIASGVTGLQQKETEQNALIQFAQQTANPIDVQYVNRALLLHNIYKRLGFKDADDVVPKNPPQAAQPQPGQPSPSGGQPNSGMGGNQSAGQPAGASGQPGISPKLAQIISTARSRQA
jgi:hypothetical protein